MSTPTNDRQDPDQNQPDPDEMRAEYDFSNGTRGKYAERYATGTNVVLLDRDVAEVFPTPEAVNEALRALATVIRHHDARASA